jgi:hypothetical protein
MIKTKRLISKDELKRGYLSQKQPIKTYEYDE